MAAAMQERSSSAADMSSALAQAQAAAAATCQPAVQHLQAALAVLGAEREPQAAELAATLQSVAGLLRALPPADVELAACVGTLGRAVGQLAAGYSHVAAMTQERGKVGTNRPFFLVPASELGRTSSQGWLAGLARRTFASGMFPDCGSDQLVNLMLMGSLLSLLQVHHILSSVNAQLQAAAAAHPSRLQAAALPGGGAGSAPPGDSPASASGLSLVELLQRLTAGVVGLVEGLAVEKECLESQMLHASDESAQLRSQVRLPLLAPPSADPVKALLSCPAARCQQVPPFEDCVLSD